MIRRSPNSGTAILVCIFAAAASVRLAAKETSRAPAVLFTVLDDMNGRMSLFDGEALIKTPNVERLAQCGLLFPHGSCASPACNPSRLATLTGLHAWRTCAYGKKANRGQWPQRVEDSIRFHTAGYSVKTIGEPVDDKPQFPPCGIDTPHSPFFAASGCHKPYENIGLPARKGARK